jgi:hypothetical protein
MKNQKKISFLAFSMIVILGIACDSRVKIESDYLSKHYAPTVLDVASEIRQFLDTNRYPPSTINDLNLPGYLLKNKLVSRILIAPEGVDNKSPIIVFLPVNDGPISDEECVVGWLDGRLSLLYVDQVVRSCPSLRIQLAQ